MRTSPSHSALSTHVPPHTGPTFRLRDPRSNTFAYCHEKEYDPLRAVKVSPDGKHLNFTAMDGTVQRPFLLHSNGYHWVMRRNVLRARARDVYL